MSMSGSRHIDKFFLLSCLFTAVSMTFADNSFFVAQKSTSIEAP